MEDAPPPRRSLPLRVLRFLAKWGTIFYTLGLALGLSAIVFIGERNAALNLGLFVPPLAWLLPLVALSPLCLLFHRRLLLWHLGCVLGVLGLFMRYHWGTPLPSSDPSLICVTNNIAQNHHLSLVPFIRSTGAQVVALQDSFPEGLQVMNSFPDWQKATVDQFVLLSQYPIGAKTAINLPDHKGPIGARFEVSLPRWGKIAIYNIRMPTPRSDLRQARYWLGKVRRDPKEIRDRTEWEEYADSLPPRIALLRGLNARVRQEKLPFLVMGDFNTPSTGYGHRLVTRGLTDCFAQVGRGYGLTFPGDLEHWVALRRPWLRLDYILASKSWEPLYCRVEEGRAAEHFAVVAGLRLRRIE